MGGPRSKVEVSRDQARLKTSNLSSESGTSTTSSSSVLAMREEVAMPVTFDNGEATIDIPSGMCSMVTAPSRIGPESRKPEAATLIRCNLGSQALMTHLGAWKLFDIRV